MVTSDQVQSLIRSALKVGGTAATCVALTDPQLGTALQSLLGSVGSLVVSVGLVWSWYTHRKVTA